MPIFTVAVRAAAALACVCTALIAADESPETFQQILAKRDLPQIEGLAQRASPDQKGETATESCLDLLKLRDEPAAAAVPELAKILAAHENSTRIHRFAAAQALFTAGGDRATRLLEKHLLAPDYPANPAVTYAAHWAMAEPARSRFIETYLLRDLDEDLGVSVHARWSEDSDKDATNRKAASAAGQDAAGKNVAGNVNHRTLKVTVTCVNESQRALVLFIDQQYQAMALHLRGPSGAFAPRAHLVVFGPDPARPVRLKPGESTSFEVALAMKTDAATLAKSRRFTSAGVLAGGNAENNKASLMSPDTSFALSEFGRYQLSAMIVQLPLHDEQKASLRKRDGIDPATVWTGRAVAKPVEVELRSVNGS